MTEFATTFSIAEEISAFLAGDNGACSDERSGENECSSSKRIGTGDGVL